MATPTAASTSPCDVSLGFPSVSFIFLASFFFGWIPSTEFLGSARAGESPDLFCFLFFFSVWLSRKCERTQNEVEQSSRKRNFRKKKLNWAREANFETGRLMKRARGRGQTVQVVKQQWNTCEPSTSGLWRCLSDRERFDLGYRRLSNAGRLINVETETRKL